MLWNELVATATECCVPWTGGRVVQAHGRTYALAGQLPSEHGWHRFVVNGGRKTRWVGPGPPDPGAAFGRPLVRGYLVGDRLLPDGVRVQTDPARLHHQGERIHLVERGLERFSRVVAIRLADSRLVYQGPEFPLGPELEVAVAFEDRAASIDHVADVTPALELAFRVEVWRRDHAERWRLELARRRAEAEQRARMLDAMGDASLRRALARTDVDAAARAALALSGACLLATRPAPAAGETVVTWRHRAQRLECVVETATLRIVDAGICLVDHGTGERGDTYFTLESLPAVVDEAIETGRLVVWRHG